MGTIERRDQVRRLIAAGGVHTQGELVAALAERGVEVTQATVSRDLAGLGVVRGFRGGRHTYLLPDDMTDGTGAAQARLRRLLADLPLAIAEAAPLVVLRTSPGAANAIASSIDLSQWGDVVGTIAGDDTIFVACTDAPAMRRFRARLERMLSDVSAETVVLAYSGGLDTSVAVPWLRETQGHEVVTLTVDVGGGVDAEAVQRRALAGGARRAIVVDARSTFVADYIWPALQAGSLYQGQYPLATALARPLIARLLVDAAHETGAGLVAHGCTGKGNDQVRFDVAVAALDPALRVIAPMRVGMGMTRDEELAYARERGIDVPSGPSSPFSIDANLWGRSIEAGVLEDPWTAPPADAFEWTVDPSDAPPEARDVVIGFEGGVPTSLDGEALDGVTLVERLNADAGAYGIGRIDHVEDRLIGIKSREIYEAPAALVLHAAHGALEQLTLSRELLAYKRSVGDRLATLAYDGLWFSELGVALRAFVTHTQRFVSGEVRMRFAAGGASVTGRRSPHSLYDIGLATYDRGDRFDHASAVGFIAIWGLPVRTQAAARGDGRDEPRSLLDELGADRADASPEPVGANR